MLSGLRLAMKIAGYWQYRAILFCNKNILMKTLLLKTRTVTLAEALMIILSVVALFGIALFIANVIVYGLHNTVNI